MFVVHFKKAGIADDKREVLGKAIPCWWREYAEANVQLPSY